MQSVIVTRGKTVVLRVSLGFNVSQQLFISEIRIAVDPGSELIASWSISFEDDGKDGELILTLDESITSEIEQTIGYMTLKRVTGSEPIDVFPTPLEVSFVDS